VDLDLADGKALVTGGSRGIGHAIAEELLREGAEVCICSRGAEELDAAARRLDADGRVHARPADVTDPGEVGSLVAWAARTMGGIDVLVNNAGRATPGGFERLSDEDWDEDLDVKLFSMIRTSRAVLPPHAPPREGPDHQHQRRLRAVPRATTPDTSTGRPTRPIGTSRPISCRRNVSLYRRRWRNGEVPVNGCWSRA
jgi:NAD(P)-dependent dehydrogenase (short-subunit alcohol dehydrogenase family)